MPTYPPDQIPLVFDAPGVARIRQVETSGGMTIELSRLEPNVDPCEAFRGLPDDECQCPHFGYVISGSLVFRMHGGEEVVVRAGDAYHIPPGHLPLTRDEACEVVEISPTHALRETMAVVEANMSAAAAG